MRKAVLFVALAYVPLLGAQGSSDNAAAVADSEAIGRIAENWKDAYNGGDAAKVASLYTDDGYYLSAHVLAHGRAAIEAYWRRGIAAGGHINFIKPLTVFASGARLHGRDLSGHQRRSDCRRQSPARLQESQRQVADCGHETVVRDQP
jgi:hypothetical protein